MSVYVIPSQVKDKSYVAKELSTILNVDYNTISQGENEYKANNPLKIYGI